MRGLREESKTRPIPLRLQLSGSGSGVLQQHIDHLSISLYMLNCITLHLSCPRITDINNTAGIYLIHIFIIIQSTHFDSSCPFMQNVLKKRKQHHQHTIRTCPEETTTKGLPSRWRRGFPWYNSSSQGLSDGLWETTKMYQKYT